MSRDIPFDNIVVGEILGPLEMLVDEKVIKEYCDEFMDHNPIYLEDSPFGGPVVPPAFMDNITGSRLLGTKYNAQSTLPAKTVYEFIHPAKVGKSLITTGKIVDKYLRRDLEYVVIEAMMVDEDGVKIRLNVHHIILSLERRATAWFRNGPVISRDKDVTRRLFMPSDDIRSVDEIAPLRKLAYQRALHEQAFPATSIHNPEYARSKSYAGALVSGYVLCCYTSEMLVNFFGPSWLRGGKLEATFINGGVQDGDDIVCRGTVTDRVSEETSIRLNLNIWMEKGQGVKVVVGKASGIQEE